MVAIDDNNRPPSYVKDGNRYKAQSGVWEPIGQYVPGDYTDSHVYTGNGWVTYAEWTGPKSPLAAPDPKVKAQPATEPVDTSGSKRRTATVLGVVAVLAIVGVGFAVSSADKGGDPVDAEVSIPSTPETVVPEESEPADEPMTNRDAEVIARAGWDNMSSGQQQTICADWKVLEDGGYSGFESAIGADYTDDELQIIWFETVGIMASECDL